MGENPFFFTMSSRPTPNLYVTLHALVADVHDVPEVNYLIHARCCGGDCMLFREWGRDRLHSQTCCAALAKSVPS